MRMAIIVMMAVVVRMVVMGAVLVKVADMVVVRECFFLRIYYSASQHQRPLPPLGTRAPSRSAVLCRAPFQVDGKAHLGLRLLL